MAREHPIDRARHDAGSQRTGDGGLWTAGTVARGTGPGSGSAPRWRRRRRRRAIVDLVLLPVELVATLIWTAARAALRPCGRALERRLPLGARYRLRRLRTYLSRRDRPLRKSIAISGVVHVACFAALAIVPARSDSPQRFQTPLVVSLITVTDTQPQVRTSPPPAETTPPDEPKPKPKPAQEPQKERPTIQEPQPKASSPPAPPVKQPEKAIRAAAAPDSMRAQPSSSINLKMATRVDEAAFTFDYYLPQVVSMISAAWMQPAGISGHGEGPAAIVRFRILRNGVVTGLTMEDPSGAALFDRSALEAVAAAQPLPPLPPAYGGQWLTVHLRFVYSDPRPAGLYRR